MLRTEHIYLSYEIVILARAERASRDPHGYVCADQLRRDIPNGQTLKEHGTLYKILHRLEEWGLLVSKLQPLSERRRGRLQRYYRITPAGKAVLNDFMADVVTKAEWRAFQKWRKARDLPS